MVVSHLKSYQNNMSGHQKYEELRTKHPEFCYQSFKFEWRAHHLYIEFDFRLGNQYSFHPHHEIALPVDFNADSIPKEELDLLVFHLGMMELISYWKAACSPRLKIKCFELNKDQINWWKKLYFNGLGEFFYLNDIQTNQNEFMEIVCEDGKQMLPPFHLNTQENIIVPIGGGKDSVVSLELLKQTPNRIIPFVVNPRGASRESIINAGFKEKDALYSKRSIHPQLLELNQRGFLNGHTPFSAMLAFLSLITARLTQSKYIALSNESSANEASIVGTNINHQYSKSFEFEEDFRYYYKKYICKDFEYFSFLRPLSELQIACLFSQHPQHFNSFKSCNVGSKENKWCGSCPKCLFTYIMLSPFIPQQQMQHFFGKQLLNDEKLKPILLQLRGKAETKPFECVGTIEEVDMALHHAEESYYQESLMQEMEKSESKDLLMKALKEWNPIHAVPKDLELFLKKKLESCWSF